MNEVSVPVVVLDKNSRAVKGLNKGDFKVLDEGKRISLLSASQRCIPASANLKNNGFGASKTGNNGDFAEKICSVSFR